MNREKLVTSIERSFPKKRALVFGNNNYSRNNRLHCSVNDAQDVSVKFEEIGFKVVSDSNLSYEKMVYKIADFRNHIEKNDLVIFFYSGHGVEWKGRTYLVPIDDRSLMENPEMCERFAICTEKLLKYMMAQEPFAVIFLLDCCRLNIDEYHNSRGKSKAIISRRESINTSPITGIAGTLVAFVCAPNTYTFDKSRNGRNSLFTFHLLRYITKPNLKVEDMMCRVCDDVWKDTEGMIVTYRVSCLRTSEIYFNTENTLVAISPNLWPIRWQTNGVTVAGGYGTGNGIYQLNSPRGFTVDEDQTVFIADRGNHRVVTWKAGSTTGQVVAGGKGDGNRLDQLNFPTDVIMDRKTGTLLICDPGNRRVMRCSFRSSLRQPEIIIDNVACSRLIIDDQGFLYVSDFVKHEVRRYDKNGDKTGTIVAGGHGEGANLNQLNWPTYLFVDAQSALYVSDWNNHRVMKWVKGARQGIVVAGGNGLGMNLTQLLTPQALWVDKSGHVYVVDEGNHQVIRWEKGAKQGTAIVGGNGQGVEANQLSHPEGLFLDHHGDLYITDTGNARVQRFSRITD